MKRRIIAWMGILLVVACGKIEPPPVVAAHSAGPFSDAVSYFVAAGEARGAANVGAMVGLIEIEFSDGLDFLTQAKCVVRALSKRKILVNRSRWEAMDTWDRRSLIAHELGHCALNQEHRTASLMLSGQISGDALRSRENFYLDELFAHSN